MTIMDFNLNNLGDFLRLNEERVNAVKVGPMLVDLNRNNLSLELSNGTSLVLVAESDTYTTSRKFTIRVFKKGKLFDSVINVEANDVLPFLEKNRLNYAVLLTLLNFRHLPKSVREPQTTLVS